MRFASFTSAAVSILSLAALASADVKLPAIFGDHMVLQRDRKVPVWGWADAGEEVTVSIGDANATATAAADGKWKTTLDSLKASDQPAELVVKGKNTVTIKDVLVGDVWVASGQSNMEWALASANNAAVEVPKADHPTIRLFIVAKKIAMEPQDDCKGTWTACTPQTAAKFSAVGYFFAREINQTQKVPVGMIGTYWGGTPAQSWASLEALKAEPKTSGYATSFEKARDGLPEAKRKLTEELMPQYEKDLAAWNEEIGTAHKEKLAQWTKDVELAKAEKKPIPPRPVPAKLEPRKPLTADQSPGTPTTLSNGMIAPIVPFAIKGAIWYQGESNAGDAVGYRTLFPTMITDWRNRWGQGDFPFLWAQIANYKKRQDQPTQAADGWAGLREAQSMALKLPNTAQAVIIDIGEAADIHPRDKINVGKRLALGARSMAYGEKIVASGPVYDSIKIEGDRARVTFKSVGEGLTIGAAPVVEGAPPAKDPAASTKDLKGFIIAGADKKFVWATAEIDGDSIIVSSPEVKEPVAVRYAWADNPEANLYNKNGLPASPFRTDDWIDPPKPPTTR
jgi:sialate O-acetylesterase